MASVVDGRVKFSEFQERLAQKADDAMAFIEDNVDDADDVELVLAGLLGLATQLDRITELLELLVIQGHEKGEG